MSSWPNSAVILGEVAHRATQSKDPCILRGPTTSSVILSEVSRRDAESKDPCILRGPTTSSVILSERSESKDPDAVGLTAIARTFLPAILLFTLLLATTPAHAQGCAQCLDSTRSTPPAVQAAYRHAIELLGGVAVTLFVAALIIFRREP